MPASGQKRANATVHRSFHDRKQLDAPGWLNRLRAGGNIHTENLEVWFGVVSTLDYDALQIQMHTQELFLLVVTRCYTGKSDGFYRPI
eukprot:COSAG06_NODE_4723_length_4002_cov_22.470664_7_plen_88_part_00